MTVSSESAPITIYTPIRTRYTRAIPAIAILIIPRSWNQNVFSPSIDPLVLREVPIDTLSISLVPGISTAAKLAHEYVYIHPARIIKRNVRIRFIG